MSEAIKIALIDDDEAIRESIADILIGEGYSVATYTNGREALDGLRKTERPRMILCDLVMPVMNGWEFLEEKSLSQEGIRKVPVVVISATPDPSTLKHGSVRAVVRKPLDVDSLLELVSKYCGRPVAS